MSYDPNIPQPTDFISVSQGDLLTNFTQLNSVYGVDHFTYNSGTNVGEHKNVTLPDRTGSEPTPAASKGDLFAITTAGVTIPYWRRDGLAGTPQFSMLPIRAFGSFTGAGATINALNCTATRNSVGLFTITISANCVTGTSYQVIPSIGVNTLNATREVFYNIISATSLQIAFRTAAQVLSDPDQFSILIMQV